MSEECSEEKDGSIISTLGDANYEDVLKFLSSKVPCEKLEEVRCITENFGDEGCFLVTLENGVLEDIMFEGTSIVYSFEKGISWHITEIFFSSKSWNVDGYGFEVTTIPDGFEINYSAIFTLKDII